MDFYFVSPERYLTELSLIPQVALIHFVRETQSFYFLDIKLLNIEDFHELQLDFKLIRESPY